MTQQDLFKVRTALLQQFLQDNHYDGILLSRADNFAMATGGKRNYVSLFTDVGACALFVTAEGDAYFVGNNIERTRVMDEELGELGCGVKDYVWYESTPAETAEQSFSGQLVSDTGALGLNVHEDLAGLRALLTLDELEKYRRLGADAATAMTTVIQAVEQGMPEADIAGMLMAEGMKRRLKVPVALVAADARIERYRHPLPTEAALMAANSTENRVNAYVMVVGGFMREGLVASMTRFRKVDQIPKEIESAHARICGVDALMQEASNLGRTLGDIFAACQRAYEDMGFERNEWHNHHQGGLTGYAGRTVLARPNEQFGVFSYGLASDVSDLTGMDVQFGHAFAWNPSAPGVKSEDTFILMPDGSKEIVTSTPALPTVDLECVLKRPVNITKSGIAS